MYPNDRELSSEFRTIASLARAICERVLMFSNLYSSTGLKEIWSRYRLADVKTSFNPLSSIVVQTGGALPDSLQDLLINLLAGIFLLLIGALIGWLISFWRNRRTLGKIWNLSDADWKSLIKLGPSSQRAGQQVFLAMTKLTHITEDYERPGTGIGEVQAYVFALESLTATYRDAIRSELDYGDDFPERHLDNNIISIGGPKHNRVTKSFRECFSRLPLGFVYGEGRACCVVDKRTDTIYEPRLQLLGNKVDYGVLSRLPNPYSPREDRNVLFLVEGAHTYGLAAAGRILTTKFSSDLVSNIKKSKSEYWQALVRTRVGNMQVYPSLVADGFVPLSADSEFLQTNEDDGNSLPESSRSRHVKASTEAYNDADEEVYTVFCDIGDVLIETSPLIEHAAKVAANKTAEDGFQITPEAFVNAYLKVDSETNRPHMNHLFGDRAVAMEALRRLTKRADIRYVGTFLSHYRNHIRTSISPSAEVTSFFKSLSEFHNVRLGIISDGTTDDQLEILRLLEIVLYLDPMLIIVSEEFGKEKISAAIYQEALKRTSSSPENTFMIGDNPERDISIPQQLGIRTIFFSKYVTSAALPSDVQPDHISKDFYDCLEFLGCVVRRETPYG